MMASADLYVSICKLPRSASGLPMLIADCCRFMPNRPNSETLATELVACFVGIGADFLHSGGHQSLISTIATVVLGIKTP
jgi:hypothetical protein